MRWLKHRWFRSLRGRLIAAYAVGLLLVAVTVGSGFVFVFVWQDDWSARHNLLQKAADKAAAGLQRHADGTPRGIVLGAQLQWLYEAFPHDIEFRVVDPQGQLLLRVDPQERLLPMDFFLPPQVGAMDLRMNGAVVQLVTVSMDGAAAGQRYYLQVAASERVIELAHLSARIPVRGSLVVTLLISIPVLIGLMLLALKSLLLPLREASDAAAHIDPRNLSARLPVTDVPTELVPLISAFNLALERLERGFRIQQQFLGTAAHELKTPLTLMRGQIEMDGMADRDTLLMDIDMMARQVHQLLHLAEASEPHNYKFEPISAVDMAVEVLDFLSRLAERHSVQLDLDLPEQALPWRADKGALFTLLKNLMENAIQHSPPGGVVTLSLDASGLSVRDEGPGIAPEHRPHLFERFWRGPSRGLIQQRGAGLGLAICQEIALAHGWQLSVVDTPTGALFRLDIQPNPSLTH